MDLLPGGRVSQLPSIRMDVEDKGDKYEITAEVPGFRKEDLRVKVENGFLNIIAKHFDEKKYDDPKRRFLKTERTVQSARRMIRLSDDADHSVGKVKARYDDGILKIDLPKLDQSKLSGHVEIAASGKDTTAEPGTQAAS